MDFIEPLYSYLPNLGKQWIMSAGLFGTATAGILFAMVKRKQLFLYQALAVEMLLVYLFLVFTSTVFSRKVNADFHYELLPFWSYLEIYKGNKYFIQENFYNILMLLPVGLLLPVCNRKNRAKKTILFGFFCSAAIELLQLVAKRGLFEFDDMMHNTLGVVIGYEGFRICRWLFYRNRK